MLRRKTYVSCRGYDGIPLRAFALRLIFIFREAMNQGGTADFLVYSPLAERFSEIARICLPRAFNFLF